MAPTLSLETTLNEESRRILLGVARDSIAYGLEHARILQLDLSKYHGELLQHAASFVTLKIQAQLRGCIGHLDATQPLVADVNQHAYQAAFADPRFDALQVSEFPLLEIHISVLGEREAVRASSETDVLRQLVPFRDGLILRLGARQATFLPAVWHSLPDPRDFLAQLKAKAGINVHEWPQDLEIWRYSACEF